MGFAKLSVTCTFILVLSLSFINAAFAQFKFDEYIVKDSSYIQGKVIPLSRDKIKFRVSRREEPIVYTAREIKEFGSAGKIYESLSINGEPNFFKRIVDSETALYRDKKQYILRHNNELIFFNAKNYRSVLQEHLNSKGKDRSLSRLSYSEIALRNFVDACNKGNCNPDIFPHRKIGIFSGYNFLQFNADVDGSSSLNGDGTSVSVGLFGDFPLISPRSLYITTELHFLNAKASLYKERKENTNFLGLDVNAVIVPLGVKWIITQGRINPYLKTGALVSYYRLNAPSVLIETASNGSDIAISRQDISPAGNFSYGFNAAAGAEIPLRNRKNFHIELKYLKSAKSDFDSFKMNFSGMFIIAGFNI